MPAADIALTWYCGFKCQILALSHHYSVALVCYGHYYLISKCWCPVRLYMLL